MKEESHEALQKPQIYPFSPEMPYSKTHKINLMFSTPSFPLT